VCFRTSLYEYDRKQDLCDPKQEEEEEEGGEGRAAQWFVT